MQQSHTDRNSNFYENKFASLDRQNDSLVYELTPEEIAIAEKAERQATSVLLNQPVAWALLNIRAIIIVLSEKLVSEGAPYVLSSMWLYSK